MVIYRISSMQTHLKLLLLLVSLFSTKAFSEQQTLLVFGDSLSAAYNMPIEKGWVSLLEHQLKNQGYDIKIVNASISGETTSGGLARFDKTLNRTKPDFIILELGANDGLRGSSLTQMWQNLMEMIELSQKNKIKLLLVGMHIPPNYGRTYTQKFDQIYQTLATDYPIVFMPFLLKDVATLSHLIQDDGLHPKEEAQPIIMENILPYVESLLSTKD